MHEYIYELDPCYFVSEPGLAWKALLKKITTIRLLTNINLILMYEKGIRRGISQAIRKYAKANNKYMKDYEKNESQIS